MVKLIEHTNPEKFNQLTGPDFSLAKKLQLGGTGSMKLIHIDGIDFIDNFDATSKSQHFLSFELRPEALIGRTYGDQSRTFVIKKDALNKINFETYNLRILTRRGIVIRHEAIIQIKLDTVNLRLYVPRSSYKPLKRFFSKD